MLRMNRLFMRMALRFISTVLNCVNAAGLLDLPLKKIIARCSLLE